MLALTAVAAANPARAADRPAVQVTTDPGLYPAFSPSVTDYVLRCSSAPSVHVAVRAPSGVSVDVGGAGGHSGAFTVAVPLKPDQSFTITVSSSGRTHTHFARCLPADFPTWGTIRLARPQAGWYLAVPQSAPGGSRYAAIFDANGVPVWWAVAKGAWYATLLSPNSIGWTDAAGALIENLDGSGGQRVTTVNTSPDFHELQRLPNGDYILIGDRPTPPVDLTPLGGPAAAVLLDNVIEEVSPTGRLVWSWDAASHISLTELQPEWVAVAAASTGAPLDVYHMNSVAPDGNGFVVSFRHLDAVYRIDRASGAITWKLGGSTTAQSLQVSGDPVFASGGDFSGQHDARVLSDGTITVHDNGSNERAPRAVRYRIDLSHRTATLLQSVGDPVASTASCCGSARVLPGGDWVVSWGYTPYVDEINPAGHVVTQIRWAPGWFSYRVDAIAPGVISPATLRADMSARVARLG